LKKLDRLEHRRILRQHRTLNQVRVTRQVLRDAVDDDVGAKLERLLEERRREGVVDDDQCATGVRRGTQRGNVVHQQARIGRRFNPHEPGPFVEGRGQRVAVRHVNLPDGTA
jgi:hypothetical protein